ncbi:hypothetical protein HID58_085839 [Brassica napus]|uniref:Uncharacterized protein n=1 Tax=Brassica napus TaxID=3708 RepID=A0ABQ7XR81_BRANA|nr:hypothetical protein HID58_085839 [Brassica napus]
MLYVFSRIPIRTPSVFVYRQYSNTRRRFLVGVGGAGVGAGAIWVVVHPELPRTQCVVAPVGSVVIHVRLHLHPLPVGTFFIVFLLRRSFAVISITLILRVTFFHRLASTFATAVIGADAAAFARAGWRCFLDFLCLLEKGLECGELLSFQTLTDLFFQPGLRQLDQLLLGAFINHRKTVKESLVFFHRHVSLADI